MNHSVSKIISVLFLSLYTSVVSSQTSTQLDEIRFLKRQEGTNWVKSYSNSAGGRLTGCTIEFNAFVHDNFYAKNRLSAIAGSYNIFYVPEYNNLRIGLKLVVNDYDFGAESVKPNPPYFATIKTKNTNKFLAAFDKDVESDTTGGRFFIYNFDESFNDVMKEVANDKMVILFNRHKGGMDISVPLDLSTVSRDDSGVVTKSKDNMDEFYKCLGGLKALVKKSTPKTSS